MQHPSFQHFLSLALALALALMDQQLHQLTVFTAFNFFDCFVFDVTKFITPTSCLLTVKHSLALMCDEDTNELSFTII